MNNTDNNKRIARNTLFLYIRMGIVMLITLYTTRIVLKVLGTEDYGIYNVVCGFVAMFGIFNTCFSTCINRFYNYEIGKKTEYGVKRVYNTAVLIQFILAVLIILSVEFVGCWYIDNIMILPAEKLETAKWIFHFAMISMFITIMQAPYSAAILAYEEMDYYAFVSILNATIKLGIIIIIQYAAGDKLLIFGMLMCVVSIVDFLLFFLYCRLKFSEIRLWRNLDRKMIKTMLSFAGWNVLDPAAYMARDQGTNMVLNSFFGPIVNASQGIAYQIATAVDNFGGSFSVSFKPQLIQSYSEGQYSRTKNLMLGMSKISYMLHIMIVIPLIIEMQYILNLWLGEVYPSYAIPFTCLILSIKCIGALNTPISSVALATGNIRKIKIFSAIVIASIVPISFILFKFNSSPISAYIALLILTIINQLGSIILLQQIFPYIRINEYFKQLIYPLFIYTICMMVLPLIINSLMSYSIWRLLLVSITSFMSSFCFGYFIVLNKSEKIMIQKVIQKVKERFKA